MVYKSAKTQEFLSRFGIMHRVASVYNPHSNQLAEGAVKAAKRMLRDNTGTQGTLDPNKFLAALLAHRNKPDPETTISSSDILFWRRIKDLMLKQQEVVITRRHLTGVPWPKTTELGALTRHSPSTSILCLCLFN